MISVWKSAVHEERRVVSVPIFCMATRSFIARRTDAGVYEGVYCHWDGYPNHNGVTLLRYYASSGGVKQLLKHGDISSLGKSVGRKHSFDNPHDGWTVYYGRDRGERRSSTEKKCFASMFQMMEYANSVGCEFLYLFDDGVWKSTSCGVQYPWIDKEMEFSEFHALAAEVDEGEEPSACEEKDSRVFVKELEENGFTIVREP